MSPRAIHQITRDDILAPEAYAAERAERRREINEIKRFRRLEVGPYATFYFENFDTMLHQVHEMLHIEKGGDAQIVDELTAYNPLVPTGRELVATLMFEIADPERRDRELRRLTFVEKTITLEVAGEIINAVAESDIERTKADGKTSSIHFLRFSLADSQVQAFREPGARVVLGISHENYGHMAQMPEPMRAALADDFD